MAWSNGHWRASVAGSHPEDLAAAWRRLQAAVTGQSPLAHESQAVRPGPADLDGALRAAGRDRQSCGARASYGQPLGGIRHGNAFWNLPQSRELQSNVVTRQRAR